MIQNTDILDFEVSTMLESTLNFEGRTNNWLLPNQIFFRLVKEMKDIGISLWFPSED